MQLRAKLRALAFGLIAILRAQISHAEGASLDAATKEQSIAAQKAFEAADVLYDAKHYTEALAAFRASYDVVRSPNTRLMIARCLRELGRLGEAYSEAKAAALEAEQVSQQHARYAEAARAAREDLRALEPRVGFVKIELGAETSGDATVRIGERSFDAGGLSDPIPITPGKIEIVLRVPDQVERRRGIVVEAGSTETVTMDAEPSRSGEPPPVAHEEPEPPAVESSAQLDRQTPVRTWAYVAGGAGALGVVTFAVFGVLNNSSYSSLESDCPDGRCPPGRNDDIEAGWRYQLIANVGLGVGIVGLGTGAALFVLSSKPPAPEQARTTLRVAPAAVSLEGHFW